MSEAGCKGQSHLPCKFQEFARRLRRKRRAGLAVPLLCSAFVVLGLLLPSSIAFFGLLRPFGPGAAEKNRRQQKASKRLPPKTSRQQSSFLGSQQALGSGTLTMGRVTTALHMEELEELLMSVKKVGGEAVVQLAPRWHDSIETFDRQYDSFAQVYRNTRFIKLAHLPESKILRLAGDVLPVGPSSIFLAYSEGRLVSQWTGTNSERFVSHLESMLPSAKQVAEERAMAQDDGWSFPSGHDLAAVSRSVTV
eukprot:TRINITY_DN116085_c0_g1_i1.p1 TRINITY_DN116085_c0_g1~~TRINITY_DN116085_c0_g1_i1.p1  ORF type:complete len:251 (-),score=46.86 TRINITY_DN116085_c0_g1_i1:65-817(-)